MLLDARKKAFDLDHAVPWGRSRADYCAFFDLGDLPRNARILDCAAGPSSFTAESTRLGWDVTAVDPLYRHSADEIARRIEAEVPRQVESLQRARDRFVWGRYGTPEKLAEMRLAAMRAFLDDYREAAGSGRYLAAGLPILPFHERRFDLALCSHFLFLYSHLFDAAFHIVAIAQLLRAAREVRIFPLLDLDGAPSAHLGPLRQALAARGAESEIRLVPYEFQRGGDRMLRILAPP
ncbi:MAG: hypothetical protein ACFCUQ_02760 [Kiloniellales bacterium]